MHVSQTPWVSTWDTQLIQLILDILRKPGGAMSRKMWLLCKYLITSNR